MPNTDQPSKKYGFAIGIIPFASITLLVFVLWYLFMHANGIMKLYTPMYGFSLVAMLMVSVVLISKVLDFYPFGPSSIEGNSRLIRGLAFSAIAVALAIFLVYVEPLAKLFQK